jgi:hypothetical protein
MLLDAASAHGLRFSPLSRETVKKLKTLLTVGTHIGNPLDAGFAALTSQDAYLKCVEILLGRPGDRSPAVAGGNSARAWYGKKGS